MSIGTGSCVGTTYLGNGQCQFMVWAPFAQQVALHIISPEERSLPLTKDGRGYHHATIDVIQPGCLYLYHLDAGKERPDPASRYQPQGVYGPSQVIDQFFPWHDQQWQGLSLEEYIIYELHVGTFTEKGTFEAIIPQLDGLLELGVTAIELMPVAQFPGNRNWGYDGVYPFAVQNSYGGPEGLKSLVNACHRKRIAVVLDVVYNHLGPEGNYVADFGPYFTDHYQTPWGAALNFDGPHSDEVRRFFIENAIYWLTEFNIDALRLDALHAILDTSAYPFLKELGVRFHEQADKLKRRAYLIGESTANDPRLIKTSEFEGCGLDAQWNDDFHHSLHVLLTGERNGYYQDFGELKHLVKAVREGFVYSGQYSQYRQRRHGISSEDVPARSFVVFAQNHDQVGNRAKGERLSQLVSFEALKLAAGIIFLCPFIPLLFMGDEYGETAPFNYFVSHFEPSLIDAVRTGRKKEFASFQWQGELSDPQDEATFLSAKLNHRLRGVGQHRIMFEFHRELIRLRKEIPALASLNKDTMAVIGDEKNRTIVIQRWNEKSRVVIVFNFNSGTSSLALPFLQGSWRKQLDSTDEQWDGKGSTVPEQLDAEAEVNLSLNPWVLLLFSKEN